MPRAACSRRPTTPRDNATQLDPVLPFSFIRRASDYSRSVAAVFSLSPGEKLFGCGESLHRLDKRGQKLVLWANDANGVENGRMYKPIPFFMSSRGYGMFVHTSTPTTFDFGASYGDTNALMLGDDELDLFVFLGSPKDILDEYTNAHRQGAHAAAVVVRPVDEPHHLLLRGRGARRGRQAAAEPHPRAT